MRGTGSGTRAGWITLAVMLLLGRGGVGVRADAPPVQKPVILFLPSRQPPAFPERVAREMAAEGFIAAGHESFEDLTLDYLRQFNAVVLYQAFMPSLNDRIRQGFDTLRAYIAEGGGLLVTKDDYSLRGQDFFRELLAPLGAEVLVEQILDDGNVYGKTMLGHAFAWTDQIVPHAVTRDVSGLAYNLDRWEPGDPGVLPVRAGTNWQVLVRGMPGAATFIPLPAASGSTAHSGPGAYSNAPPLLAVRDSGKGRVALWPTLATFTLLDGYSLLLDHGMVMDSRRGTQRSDGARLMYNLLHWLSEPSRASTNFGRYLAPPPPPPPPPDLGFKPMDWGKTNAFGPSFAHAYRGLIGARTGLSTGEGTPEEFIAEARKAGFDFLAFAEDINAMPRENWDQLTASCLAATTTNFLALPGYYYLDNEGDAFVVIGTDVYPPPEWADPKDPSRKILYNGTIRMALAETPPIILLPLAANKRPARYHSSFYGYALQVWEDGQLAAENWEDYVELQKEQLSLFPTAVHLVKRPAEVAAARTQGLQAWVRADALATLLKSIDGLSSGHYRWHKPAYPSSGPEICTFYAENWGTSDQAVPGNDRFRLQMLVRSDPGLAEVQLYDRYTLIRRWRLDGAREFKQTLDEYHTQQRTFLLVAVDTAGGRAVSWPRATNVQEGWITMCGDNMNDMGPGGKIMLDRGKVQLAGTECVATPFGPGAAWPWPNLMARRADGTAVDNPSYRAGMKDCVLVSRFGMILNYPLGYYWDGPGTIGAAYPAPLEINPWFGGTYRTHRFTRRPPGPDLEVREYEFTFKQDVELTETPGVVLLSSHNFKLHDGQLDHVATFTARQGRVVEAPTRDAGPLSLALAVAPGEYAAIFPMCLAVYPLDEELQVTVYRHPGGDSGMTLMRAGLGRQGEKFTGGSSVRARFGVLSLPFAPEGEYSWLPNYKRYWNSNLLPEEVREKMGLAGPPAYQVKPLVGAVLDTRLALRLQADAGGFRATIGQCHLPAALPVYIEGLNPRWSAAVWYRGTNTLLQTEWPPGYHQGKPAHRRYVQARRKTDEILRIGTFDDGIGYLQLDMESGDRDVFIGNLVTCDRADFPLVFHRQAAGGPAAVEVHNPTDREADVTVRPGKGFDLYGEFSKAVRIPGGSSRYVEVP